MKRTEAQVQAEFDAVDEEMSARIMADKPTVAIDKKHKKLYQELVNLLLQQREKAQ